MARATIRTAELDSNGDSPSEQIVKAASQIEYVTDARGRKIGVEKPRALLRFRLLKILGADNSKNEILLGNAMLAFLVRSINGDPQPPINTERMLEAAIDRLDDDGLSAVAECLVDKFGVGHQENTDEDIKN